MEGELRCELGTTFTLEPRSADEAVRLAQYELPTLGHPFKCLRTNKTLQRFDLPTLPGDTPNHNITSFNGKLGFVSSLKSDGNDFYKDWFQLTLELIEEARNLSEHKFKGIDPLVLPSIELSWQEAFRKVDQLRKQLEPPIQPVVDIAKNAWPTLQYLLKSPRRVLKRERELVGLERLSEIDEGCIRWMVRQSGRTLAERAGSTQKLLGVVRKDDFDTIENRVVNDLTLKIDRQSRDYSNRYKSFNNSERFVMVKSFGAKVASERKGSSLIKASSLQVVPKPNFVLQFDPLYSRAWHWYIKLIRQEEQLQLASKWRSKLWREFVFIFLNNIFCKSKKFIHKPSDKFSLRQFQVVGSSISNAVSPLFWDKESKIIAQVLPADYPRSLDRSLGPKFGSVFGMTGASLALVFWKLGNSKPLLIKYIITESKKYEHQTPMEDHHTYAESVVKSLKKDFAFEVCVVSPSSDLDKNPTQVSGSGLPVFAVPSKNEDWGDDSFTTLGKLLAPEFL